MAKKKVATAHDAAANGAAAPAVVSIPAEFRVVRWFIWACTVSADTLGCLACACVVVFCCISPTDHRLAFAAPLMRLPISLVLCRFLGWPGDWYACIDEPTANRHCSHLRVNQPSQSAVRWQVGSLPGEPRAWTISDFAVLQAVPVTLSAA
jgi:hypothetical protein